MVELYPRGQNGSKTVVCFFLF